ncbi:MAG: TIGR02757 family protein [Rhodothermales bacterium]|nr:TIGR02757 family protein [Rhodothermales bacterium]
MTPTLSAYLDLLVRRFEQPDFIPSDPISVPHAFDDPGDQEIAGLFAALLAWGQRGTVLRKMDELCGRMGYQPHAFVLHYTPERDAECLAGFKHRTFQPADACWLVHALSAALHRYGSVEAIFLAHLPPDAPHIGPAIQGFSDTLLTILPDTPPRLAKHLARPAAGSACKRLAMYARWMVRPGPVDLGIWRGIRPDQLILPVDVHAGRQARALGLLQRQTDDWRAAQELTEACRRLCPEDPCRYDYAFFGAGAYEVELDKRFVVGVTR